MKEQALEWLHKQLKQKRWALFNAQKKPNPQKEELENIKTSTNILEWIIKETKRGLPEETKHGIRGKIPARCGR